MAGIHAWAHERDGEWFGYIAVGEMQVWESAIGHPERRSAQRAAEATMRRGLEDLFRRFEVIPT